MVFGIQFILIVAFFRYLLSYDRCGKRLGQLYINGCVVSGSRIMIASNWSNRRIGLLNHAQLDQNAGLLLMKARSIHTQGMLFPIDVICLDRNDRILAIFESAKPGVKLIFPKKTRSVLELASGSAKSFFSLEREALIEVKS